MIDTAEIYQMRQYEPSEKERKFEWLNTEHVCEGTRAVHVQVDEISEHVLACAECEWAWKELYNAKRSPALSQAA